MLFVYFSDCSKLTPILELINTQSTNLHGLSVLLEHLLEEIKSIQSNQGASVQSLKGSYNEHGAFMTEQMRVDIITTIDENQQNIHEEMFTRVLSILNEFDNSIVKTISEIKNEVISIQGSLTSSIHKCIGLQNDLLHFNEIIQKIGDNKELCFIASIKSKHIIQQALIVLGTSDKVLTVKRRSDHKVNIPSDSRTCWITAICVLADGDVLLADFRNDKVKVMNKNYKVVGHCDVYGTPFDMCQITTSEVAVTVGDGKINKVQFFTVKESQLVKCRKLQLHHACTGICHHQGDLFLCSGTALYKYSLCGKLICKLYEDGSAGLTQCLTGKNHD
ncbi:hypothetical protein DPMN_152397 [Dreissena polymorpha]|uniref:Uncharacterized protein n=1 Tax=Dreissena polymorpha TaxID=45954 RepID=A0A9D4FJG1_DREPO|nr:hypothetical protein DPMN_152397 [Dreissena polymorpha]